MKFTKPALSFSAQVQLLASRGLVIDDLAAAEAFLTHVNYYRFAGYILPFESDHATHTIRLGTRFEDVRSLYQFDRELRLLLLDAIEKIEVSVRTQWAYQFAHALGSHAYLEPAHSSSQRQLVRQLTILAGTVEKNEEAFVVHHRTKYQSPDFPPVWVACELMSLGQLSQWYTLMKPGMRQKIARCYAIDQQVLQSVLHHLTHVRNICAHHAKLWNRELVITSSLPKKGVPELIAAIDDKNSSRLYKTLCLIVHLLSTIDSTTTWRSRLVVFLQANASYLSAMGFPANWHERQLWI